MATYIDERFFTPSTYQKEKFTKIEKSHRKSKPIKAESNWDALTVIQLILFFILIILSLALVYKNYKSIPFCSSDSAFGKCMPCPQNAICSKGRAQCQKGYKLHGTICIIDNEIQRKTYQLALKIGEYIASQPNSNCNESIHISYDEIQSKYNNEEYFYDSLEIITKTSYDIHFVDNYFVSYRPNLDMKCKVIIFMKTNQISIALFVISLTLLYVLISMVNSKRKLHQQIDLYGEKIINQLKEQNGKMVFVDELAPIETNVLYQHWDRIVSRVESDPHVEVFNASKGKVWKYVS